MTDSRHLSPTILRANDIRGTYGQDLTEDDARVIGMAYGTMAVQNRAKQVALCRDGRISSPALAAAMAEGLASTGLEVLDLGLGPTPLMYFAVHHFALDGGVMITGSHNPPNMNGMKIMLGQKSFHGEKITELGRVAAAGMFTKGAGQVSNLDAATPYLEALIAAFGRGRALTCAWDPGNGASGEIVERLVKKLPGRHHVIFAEVDGTFPNHHADPTVPENLRDLIALVQRENCDLGFAFDGDGDRIGVVDRAGNILWGDQMLALFAEDLLKERPGATIIADVKASETLFQRIAELGGQPLMWKTGHSFIKTKMAETGALLAGEMSGHLFFADRYFGFDDGVYAACRFAASIASHPESLAQRLAKLGQVENTPELRFECSEERKFAVIEEARKRLASRSEYRVETVDGLRVTTADGWWLLRASNTQAVLVGRCEGRDKAGLERLKAELFAELEASGVSPPLVH